MKKSILALMFLLFSGIAFSQTTVTLQDQCNCEVLKGTDVSSPGAATPTGADLGDIYVNTNTGTIYFWDGNSWELTASDNQQLTGFTFNDVTNILSLSLEDGGNVNVDLSSLSDVFADSNTTVTSFDIDGTNTNLVITDSDANSYAVALADLAALINTDNQTLNEVLVQGNDAGGSAITNLADPTAAQDAATKAYVDSTADDDITGVSFNGGTNEVTVSEGATSFSADLSSLEESADIAANASDIATNTADITTNASNISTNTADIATNTTDITTNASNISTNTTDIATNTTAIATNTTDIATNTTDIANHIAADGDLSSTNEIQNIEEVLTDGNDANGLVLTGLGAPTAASDAATKAYVDSTADDDITGVSFNGGTNEVTVSEGATSFSADLSSLEESADIAANASDIATNTTDIATNASDIATNTTDIANHIAADGDLSSTNEIQNIEEVLTDGNDANGLVLTGLGAPTAASDAATKAYVDSTADDDITGVSFNGGTNEVTVSEGATSFSADLSSLEESADIAANASDIATNAAAISTNTTDIATNTADITTNASNISTNTTDIATNASDIATNTADITTNASNISTNTADIATNTTAIATNTTDISTNTTDIANHIAADGDLSSTNEIQNIEEVLTDGNDANGLVLTGLGAPTAASDAATKAYVDSTADDDITGVSFNGGTNEVTVSEGATSFSADLSSLEESADIAANAADIATNTAAISTNTTDIATNTTDIATNAADITTNASNISTNASDIATNTTDIATNATDVATNTAAISTNTTDITTNASNISTNTADIATNTTAIATNTTDIATNTTDIANHIAADGDLSSTNEIQNIEEVLTDGNDANGLVLTGLGAPTAASDAATKAYVDSTADDDITGVSFNGGTNEVTVSEGATSFSADLSSLEESADIAANTSDIATNTTAISTNTTDIATNTTDIATNTTDIATNASNISTNASDIATNTTDIATNATDVATNTAAISTNTTDITTNASNISTNTADIATNTTAIATNTTDISTNTTDIANHIAADGDLSSTNEIQDAIDVPYDASTTTLTSTNVQNVIEELKSEVDAFAATSGQTNTASNVGSSGTGLFARKTGADLEFKNINAGSNKITITDDGANDEVDIDINEANLTVTSDLATHIAADGDLSSTNEIQNIEEVLTDGNDANGLVLTGLGAPTAASDAATKAYVDSTADDDITGVSFNGGTNEVTVSEGATSFSADLSSLEESADIAANASDIATNAADITTNASNISTNTTDIATNASDIATNTADITTNASNISTNTADIATNTTAIATNTTDIATNTADIATNTTDIATNASNISTNTTDIANHIAADGDLSSTNEIQNIEEVLTDGNDANGLVLTGLGAPMAASDAATKGYVDSTADDDITGVSFNGGTNEVTVSEGATSFSADLSSLEESADIAANASDIATNAADITTNASNISTNTADIATNTTAIATNTTDISTNTTDIANHIAADGDLSSTNEIQNIEEVLTDGNDANGLVLTGLGAPTAASDAATKAYVDSTADDDITGVSFNGGTNEVTVSEGATSFSADLSSLEESADIAANASDIATNTTAIATNTTDIATNTADIATNTTDIATNASNISTNTTDIANHIAADGDLSSTNEIQNIEEVLTDGNDANGLVLTGLGAPTAASDAATKAYVDSTADDDITGVSFNGGTNEVTVSEGATSFSADLSSLEESADIAANASDIAANTADITTNASNISTNTADIATNASDITTNTTDIATNASDIATNTADITTNASNISTNTADIATNTTAIATNTTDIAANTTDIANHIAADGDLSSTNEIQNIEEVLTDGNDANGLVLTGLGAPTAASDAATKAYVDSTADDDITGVSFNGGTNEVTVSEGATSFSADLSSLEESADIAANASDIATNTADITTNASNISTNTADIATNTAAISTNTTDITTNASNISTNASNISTNTADIATNTTAIATNTTDIATNTTDIANHIAADGDLSSTNEIQNIEEVLTDGNDANGLVLTGLGAPTAASDAATKAYVDSTADDDITGVSFNGGTNEVTVSEGATSFSADLSSLEESADIAANATDIATNAADITTNASNISTNTTDIATNASDIATNTADITTNASNISTNTTDIATNTADIATNTTDIATNASNISTNASNISTNTADIATNTTAIATNTTDISTNTTDIANHIAADGDLSSTNEIQNIEEVLTDGNDANGLVLTGLGAPTAASDAATKAYVDSTADDDITGVSFNGGTNEVTVSEGATSFSADLSSLEESADIAANASDIATNTTAIATNTTDIATNTADIATNTTDIATNASNISTNTTDIANHIAADGDLSSTNEIQNIEEVLTDGNDANGLVLTGLGAPTAASDAATKAYVDSTADDDITGVSFNGGTNEVTVSEGATSFSADLSSLEESADIAANATDIATNAADITTNASNISTNTTDIATNTADIATNTTDIATNASNISTNTTDIATNASNISTNTTDIATNASDIATNTADITTNASNISTNTADIATNTTAIATNTTDIANHIAADGDLSSTNEIQNIEEVLTDGNDANGLVLTGLGAPTAASDAATKAYVDSTADDDITGVSFNGGTNEVTVSEGATSFSADLSSLEESADIAANASDIATNTAAISTNTTDIATNTADITTNASDISTNTTDIATNASDIAANTADITTNASNISTNTADIATNTTAIATNTTDIATNTTDIANHIAADGDLSSTNEINIRFEVNGTNLEIEDSNGTLQVPLTDINTDNQVASEVNSDAPIDVDGDGNTEATVEDVIQDIAPITSKAARIFYPPSIAIDASTNGTFSLDLYQEYIDQYGSPTIGSTGAPLAIPTYARTDLYYYVTYADPTVFDTGSMSIDANGNLSYTVQAQPSDYNALINVVFVVK